jgi:gas vesicle protein
MLNFIKKLLKNKEKIGLPLDRLESWFEEKTKEFYDHINNNTKNIKENILEEIKKTKESLENLKNAQLKNDKIPIKEKQFMEGSRDLYIKRINIFLDSIKIPDENIDKFIEKIHTDLELLGKSTFKAYKILQHFFNDETYKIAQNLKNLENHSKNINEILNDKKAKIASEIKEDISSLKENIEKEKKLKKNIEEIENNINDLLKEKRKILAEISNKEQSSDFKEYHRLDVEKYQIKEQIEELKTDILHYFSSLEHPIKKYINLHPEEDEFLKNYIENPIKSLVEDYHLKIKNILENLKEDIQENNIELKDKKKDKILNILNQINEVRLASFLTEYNQFMVNLRDLGERIKNHTIIDEIEDIKIRLRDKKKEIEEINKKLEETKNMLSKINISDIKTRLKQKIDDLLDIELNLD